MEQKTVYELFDELAPKQKASFIDARLDWASCGALCGEMTTRLCSPMSDHPCLTLGIHAEPK